jgi:hypothetical protein
MAWVGLPHFTQVGFGGLLPSPLLGRVTISIFIEKFNH